MDSYQKIPISTLATILYYVYIYLLEDGSDRYLYYRKIAGIYENISAIA